MAYTAASDANVDNVSNAACVWYYVSMGFTGSGSISFVLLLGYVRYRSLSDHSYVKPTLVWAFSTFGLYSVSFWFAL